MRDVHERYPGQKMAWCYQFACCIFSDKLAWMGERRMVGGEW